MTCITLVAALVAMLPGLNPTTAQLAANQKLPALKKCYRQTLEVKPKSFGAVKIAFRVGVDGKSLDRWLSLSTLGDPDLEACILEAVEGVAFPAPGKDGEQLVQVSVLLVTDETPEEVVTKQEELLKRGGIGGR